MLAYSARNRSASCRIPWVSNPKARRIEMRFPDPIQSGYLTFTALMMAGLDGIKNQIDPGAPSDKDLYDLPPEEADPAGLLLAGPGAGSAGQGPRVPQGRRRDER